METLLTNVGSFFTQAMTWMGNVLDTVVDSPALLILVIAMPVVGQLGRLRIAGKFNFRFIKI